MGFQRRHSRWYEQILFSGFFQLVLGFAIIVVLPAWFRWPEAIVDWSFSPTAWNTIIVNAAAFFVLFVAVRYLRNFPGAQSLGYVFPTVAIIWLLAVAAMFFFRFDYSRQAILHAYLLANVWVMTGGVLWRKYRLLKLAVVPVGKGLSLTQTSRATITLLDTPNLCGRRYDAVVADLHADDLQPQWERFLTQCVLARMPVFHVKQVQESLTGRVQIEHLSENEFGALLPSSFYENAKRLLDLLLVLASAPFWLPVMLITGIIIKLESDGPMFFTQERVGQGNKPFIVFKLRSMTKDSEKSGAQFACDNDMRVTRVGKFIRKSRIDEIPQFINVLKGDMSLIGPRPEQKVFVDQFEKEIPFYAYRHVVKPGITGWAQVTQGYAADADETRIKIEHDFYYIKNFSLWLDILIVFKTIKTIFTGFGAR